MELAVVILNHNTRDLLRDCLRSLEQAEGVEFDTYVVDNSSADNSAAMVRREFPLVRLIENANSGYGAGNNVALRRILALANPPPAILLLNPDTVMPPDALRGLLDFLVLHTDVGVVGPKLVRADGSLDLACRRSFPTPKVSFYRLTGLAKLFPRSPRFARYNLTYLDQNVTTQVDSTAGACMLIRTPVLQQAGIFDEDFFMYGEDLDLCLRIKKDGWKVMYYPGVTVLHYKRESSRQSPRAHREFWRAMRIFYRKHYAASTPFVVHWLVLLGLTLGGGMNAFRNQRSEIPRPPDYGGNAEAA